MIIHCLTCGKSISSHGHSCPYCCSQLTDLTLEINGIEDRSNFKAKMKDMVWGLVRK